MEGYITSKEAAERLGLTRRRVYQLIDEGEIKAVQFGKSWAIEEKSVDEYEPGPVGWPKGRPRKDRDND